MENTQYVNEINRRIIKHHIQQKISTEPYFPDPDLMDDTITDMDHFPYTRFYRGKYYMNEPQVFDREPGFRAINNNCYAQCSANYLPPY